MAVAHAIHAGSTHLGINGLDPAICRGDIGHCCKETLPGCFCCFTEHDGTCVVGVQCAGCAGVDNPACHHFERGQLHSCEQYKAYRYRDG